MMIPLLALIHPLISEDPDVGGVFCLFREGGSAQAHAYLQGMAVHLEWLGDDFHQPLFQFLLERFVVVRGNHQGEFVAADAEGVVALADAFLQSLGCFLQHDVAGGVAVGVVDGFEFIQVQVEEYEGLVPIFLDREDHIEIPFIEEPREAVGVCHIFQGVLFADVLTDEEHALQISFVIPAGGHHGHELVSFLLPAHVFEFEYAVLVGEDLPEVGLR